jgi:hypothetical protein
MDRSEFAFNVRANAAAEKLLMVCDVDAGPGELPWLSFASGMFTSVRSSAGKAAARPEFAETRHRSATTKPVEDFKAVASLSCTAPGRVLQQ